MKIINQKIANKKYNNTLNIYKLIIKKHFRYLIIN